MSEPTKPKVREYAIRVVCPHGNALLLMGTERDEIESSADELLGALRCGFIVERVTVSEARKSPFGCACCRREWDAAIRAEVEPMSERGEEAVRRVAERHFPGWIDEETGESFWHCEACLEIGQKRFEAALREIWAEAAAEERRACAEVARQYEVRNRGFADRFDRNDQQKMVDRALANVAEDQRIAEAIEARGQREDG